MPVKVTVKYWDNKRYGFGHIAVEVADSNSNRKHYVSWALTNNLDVDVQTHGKQPINIVLPESNRSFEEFEKLYKKSPYYLSDEVLQFIEYTRNGEGSKDRQKAIERHRELSPTDKLKNRNYKTPYNIFAHNCGHSVLDILYFSGHLAKQPKHKFGLRPYTVAKLACKIANTHLSNENIKINPEMDDDQKLRQSMLHMIEMLEFKRVQQLSDHFSTSLSDIEKDIRSLKRAEFHLATYTSANINSVKNLIKTIVELVSLVAIKEAKNCLSLIPEDVLVEARVSIAFDSLIQAHNILSEAFTKSFNISSKHIEKIEEAAENLLVYHSNYVNSTWDKDKFERKFSKSLEEIKPLLSKYKLSCDDIDKLKKIDPKTEKHGVISLFFNRSGSSSSSGTNCNNAASISSSQSNSSLASYLSITTCS